MEVIGELHGHSCIGRLMLFYARGPSSIVDHRNSIGAANAGLVFFHDQLNFSMVSHPKVNPTCVELTRLSYDITSKFLRYFRLSSEEKSPDIEIPLDTPTMTHDFTITENSVMDVEFF